jgi:uncharacterized membrane protein YkvA (DUF1232 family)
MNRQYSWVLRRILFKHLKSEAEEFARDKEKTRSLIARAIEKANKNKDKLKEIWNDLTALIRLMRAWAKGEYKDISWKTITFIIVAIIYFVNPFDVVPDLFPLLGFADDAAVIGFVITSIRKDIQQFLEWEEKRK